MKYFCSEYFKYKKNKLYCENASIDELVKNYGTPLFVYSKKFFEDRYNEFSKAFKNIDSEIFYASKANSNINVIKTFANMGSGIDVNSGGELYRALKAGVKPQKILFTGVGKTAEEIEMGLRKKVFMIKAESLSEVYLINKIAKKMKVKADVAFRVNPDVDPKTHPYISTGLSENKFGISSEDAPKFFSEADKLSNINMVGLDMHIGSQITSVSPFVEAVKKMVKLLHKLRKNGINIEHLDIGGGMGVLYKDETPLNIKEFAKSLIPLLKNIECKIIFEPGRFLTANGGILISEVLYSKKNHSKNFIIVDAAMNDLLRPSIYGAYHHIQPIEKNRRKNFIADIAGPICESGDFVAKEREITRLDEGEKIAIMSAGAYGMVMSSNYNARRRAAEVLVYDDKYSIIRSRETYKHLLYDEKIIKELA